MTTYDDTNRGIMFVNGRKTKQGQPDWNGNVTLGPDVLEHLANQIKAGKPAVVELSGWNKKTRKGDDMISVSSSIPWQERKGPASQPSARNSGSASLYDADDDIPF